MIFHLTGTPTVNYKNSDIKDVDEYWEMLKIAYSQGAIMTSSCYGEKEEIKEDGLVRHHSYSVLSVNEFKHM